MFKMAFLDTCRVGRSGIDEASLSGDNESSIGLNVSSFDFDFDFLDEDADDDEEDALLVFIFERDDTESDRCIKARLGDGDEKLSALSDEFEFSFKL